MVKERDGTCIVHRSEPGVTPEGWNVTRWYAKCGHGAEWLLGHTRDGCIECVLARCDHAKAGVPIEQGSLL